MRAAEIWMFGKCAGRLWENEEGFFFHYANEYVDDAGVAISVTLPLTKEVYRDRSLFPFFDGLIPEGWLLEIASDSWKLDPNDRMGLLLACCRDCIGAVSVRAVEEVGNE